MISQSAEYALRAVVFLADGGKDKAMTAHDIAEGTKAPLGYLAKLMQALVKSKLVTSQRGLNGGFTLIPAISDITVYDVVHAVAPVTRITRCPLGIEGHGTNLCPLHRGLDNAMAAVEVSFRKMTIHQLLNQPKATRPLCSFPRVQSECDSPQAIP